MTLPHGHRAVEQIAFRTERDGNYEIYVTDADGANPQNLTNNPESDSGPLMVT